MRLLKGLSIATWVVGVLLMGCNAAPKGKSAAGAEPRAESLSGSAARPAPSPREMELSAQVESSREAYHRYLMTLHDFYAANGFEAKRKWAEFELKGLGKVKAYRYAATAPAGEPQPRATGG